MRCFVTEYKGNNKACFECPVGHTFTMSLMKKDPRGKLPSEVMLQKMAHWWSKPQGVIVDCPRCLKTNPKRKS